MAAAIRGKHLQNAVDTVLSGLSADRNRIPESNSLMAVPQERQKEKL